MNDDSLELLGRMQAGDPAALEALLTRHLPALRAYVRLNGGGIVRAKEESVDIVQSVCREVLGKLDNFRYPSEGGFRRWLYTTALRKIRDRHDYYTAAKRDARRERPPVSGEAGDLARVYASIGTPSRVASAREDVERLEAAFDRLPEHYREVIVLAHIVGLSRDEIAAQTEKSVVAVRSLLYRASARLAALLDEG